MTIADVIPFMVEKIMRNDWIMLCKYMRLSRNEMRKDLLLLWLQKNTISTSIVA